MKMRDSGCTRLWRVYQNDDITSVILGTNGAESGSAKRGFQNLLFDI